MKRSAMIETIVYEALSWDGLDTSGVSAEEIANDMLRAVEAAGMRPPHTKVINCNCYDHNWEPEE